MDEYRRVGEEIKKATRKAWRPPPYYFHLWRGGHIRALQRHLRNSYFVRFDIEDFFERVNQTRVTRCLKEYFSYAEARKMAVNSTVRHPTESGRWVLPYGFVQSPILASLALAKSRVGTILNRLHKMSSISVSVYVDDISVSCNDLAKLEEACEALIPAAMKAGLAFNGKRSFEDICL